jgi:hypothetical protein
MPALDYKMRGKICPTNTLYVVSVPSDQNKTISYKSAVVIKGYDVIKQLIR